ncbi:hypothetical protein ACQKLX_07350 [Bosea sp. NPDC003192]|uniref:hypothetical protein n=1 Tax=Bosea sp. NPDC003192 TaxID=3390551 RepID=UPI003D02CA7C
MTEAAGRITVLYHPPGELHDAHGELDIGGLAGHVAVIVTDGEDGRSYALDVWSTEGKPFWAPMLLNPDPTSDEDRFNEFSQLSWTLTADQLEGALDAVNYYHVNAMDYEVIGQSCVDSVLDVLKGAHLTPENVLTPWGVWNDLQQIASTLPDVHLNVCEAHKFEFVTDPDANSASVQFPVPANFVSVPWSSEP